MKWLKQAVRFLFIFSLVFLINNSAFADNRLLKLSNDSLIVGSKLTGNILNDDIEQVRFVVGDKIIDLNPVENSNTCIRQIEFLPESTGTYKILYKMNNQENFVDQGDSFSVVGSLSDLFPGQEAPYIDDSKYSQVEDADKAIENLSRIRAYSEVMEPLAINITMKKVDEDKEYSFEIFNDGLSVETTQPTDEKIEVGKYLVKVILNGKVLERELELLNNSSSRLSADPSKTFRLYGADRYETAIEISKETFKKAPAVVLANGNNFPDALAGCSLASTLGGPILYSNKTSLDSQTLNEIKRLGASVAYIVGGSASISTTAESQLKKIGVMANRIQGSNRQQTAIKIAQFVKGKINFDTVIFVDARNFPDALSASALSGIKGYPILYVDGNIDGQLKTFIDKNNVELSIIVGGDNSVSKEFENQLTNLGIITTRIKGTNRYDTSGNLAKKYFNSSKVLTVASGENFPDALAGGVLAAKKEAPILLNSSDSLEEAVKSKIDNKVESIYIFGGSRTIANNVAGEIKALLSKNQVKIEPFKIINIAADDYRQRSLDEVLSSNDIYKIGVRKPTADRPIRILLDQGHGWHYNKGIVDGYYEGNGMYWYGLLLRNELVKYGFDVKVMREDIEAERLYCEQNKLASTDGFGRTELSMRGPQGEGYDLYLSLHSNATGTPINHNVWGTEVYDSTTTPLTELAEKLGNTIANHFDHPFRGVKYRKNDDNSNRNYYRVLRTSLARHSMLVEHGYHTNLHDCTKLMDKDFKQEMAEKVAKVLAEFYQMPADN